MPHAPSDTTTLTILSEELARVILDDVNNPDISTNHLVCKATSFIDCTLSRTHTIEGLSIETAPILQSVLNHAPCEHGRRYIACAIIWCGPNEQKLVELANDLVKFLLLPFFRASKNISPPTSKTSSPALLTTQQVLDTIEHNTPASFRPLLETRQNEECAIIRKLPNSSLGTRSAHITKPSFAKEDDSDDTNFAIHRPFQATWNIIHHYANISLDVLQDRIDSPENGILMSIDMHRAFEKFEWCLIPTGQPSEYTVKWLTELPLAIFVLLGRPVVTFADDSSNSIPLPKPEYLALHAAIAHILHETRLGEYFETIAAYFFPNSSTIPWKKFNDTDFLLRAALMNHNPHIHNNV
ncbi:hypothetical protein QCA50_016107 [Cerrena zonata]|uniref:HNH nuclease domain-containing protein n=1 Tax=Cerrena zonata TaxID=2478898 RepID=A0AAW0FRD9_9APHY